MDAKAALRRQLSIGRQFWVQFVSIVVAADGILILATTLLDQLATRHATHLTSPHVDLPLLVGLSLLYLSRLIARRKHRAWLVTVLAYTFYIGFNLENIFDLHDSHHLQGMVVIRVIILPLIILGLLLIQQKEFIVRSDTQGFRVAVRFTLAILLVAFVYGVAGFLLLDKSDFHQEIPLTSAMHHTIDQLGLTTNPPHPYTRRAKLFLSSLSFVSIGAVAYAVIAFFQPLRARFSDQTASRQHMAELIALQHDAASEDFFKLWPQDKQYFFDHAGKSGLAFRVNRGLALVVGGPAGKQSRFKQLIIEFGAFCYSNDWQPALIHIEGTHRQLLEMANFTLQKIGEEAIIDLDHFQKEVADNKFFRNIKNRFEKQGFTTELLKPPHHSAIINRLKDISDDWLSQGGRVERGFVMGYFSEQYLQQCEVMVVRDAAGTIQAFLNNVPADFDKVEGTFDMLRHAHGSLGNINDYLLVNFIASLSADGYKRLNLGLCPLIGLDDVGEEKRTLINSVMQFAYANGDRFYSFSGLYRFKNKYEPNWRDRYIAYQGGIRGFSRTMNALMRTMRHIR